MLTLKLIKEVFGGAEGYMIEKCKLTKEEIERIRTNLIVEQPSIYS
jgi:hypothetical protein